jgi:hemerythrin
VKSEDLKRRVYLKWSDKYSVNVTEIDEQHKKLFSLVNGMYDAMHARRGRDMIEKVIAEFVDYTDYHFKTEEALLRYHAYPAYEDHKEMHDRLVREAHRIKEAFDSGNTPTAIEVMLILTNWLNIHILEQDRKYKPYVEGKATN